MANSGKPCLKYGEIYTTHKIWFNKCISYLGETNLKSYRYCEYGDLLFAIDGETPEEIGTCVTYLGKEKLIIDTHIVVIKHKQNPKYLAYALSTFDAQKQKIKLSNINQIVGINKEKLKKIKIPIPSLEKQQKISDLLDKFWKLSNNIREGLPTEILLRKQQYEYYRDKLLK
ncbi:hypothetical protein A6V39_05285 [Candidatus Mycoplasma haematobovis]|uniref:Type I restriction modification DNA specificity domain-containing protein n=1 Tax=Candidatus Mycoplasma haematobovis TaxID=432608 RepID=A0A1A9QBX9_9MOLU|nr:hypothetical protein A6V39_05285 [Candidatus Mycoplasma haematobovis]